MRQQSFKNLFLQINKYCKKSFLTISFFLFSATLLGNLLHYFFHIITAKYLSVELYGELNVVLSLIIFFSIIYSPLQNFITKESSIIKAQEASAALFFKFTFSKLLLYILSFTILPIILVIISGNRANVSPMHIFIVICYGIIGIIHINILAIAQGVQHFIIVAIVTTAFPALTFMSAMGLLISSDTITAILVIRLILNIIILVFLYSFLKKRIQNTVYANKIQSYHLHTKHFFSYFLLVGFAHICANILMQADIVIVRFFFTPYITGIYASSAVLGKIVLYLPGALSLIIFPVVTGNNVSGKSSISILIKACILNILLSGGGALLLFFFPEYIITSLFGTKYMNAISTIRFYPFAFMPISMIHIFFTYFLAKEKYICILPIGLAVLIEIIGTYLFHTSLMQVLVNIFIAGCIGNIIFIIVLYDEYRKHKLNK